MLSLEQAGKLTSEEQLAQLRATLSATESERDRYKGLYEELGTGTATAGCNVLRGRLLESAFLGNIVDHQVDVDGMLVRVQGSRREGIAPGSLVELMIPIGDCVAMHNDTD